MSSIHSPEVRAYALRHGVTELQAYRAVQAKAALVRGGYQGRTLFERVRDQH